jgi:hypothetical protein
MRRKAAAHAKEVWLAARQWVATLPCGVTVTPVTRRFLDARLGMDRLIDPVLRRTMAARKRRD